MDIKPEEWLEFAKFIACHTIHNCTQWIEDGEYVICPFSNIERAYDAFKIGQERGNWYCDDVESLYDIDYKSYNPINQIYNEDDMSDDTYPYYNDVMSDE